MSPFRPTSSGEESEPPHGAKQVRTMRLLSPFNEKSHVTVKALIEDVNETTSRQGYNVVIKWGNKKDKNEDLCKVKLGCTKGGEYKENKREV